MISSTTVAVFGIACAFFWYVILYYILGASIILALIIAFIIGLGVVWYGNDVGGHSNGKA